MTNLRPMHPGTILREELVEDVRLHGLIDRYFHMFPVKTPLDDILDGRASITPEAAECIERATGVSHAFWLNLQQQYDEWKRE